MKTETFAPPLVPTGKDYADNATFGRKNAVYLDISAAYMAEVIFCYSCFFNCSNAYIIHFFYLTDDQ